MSKNKKDLKKLGLKIMALILTALMVLSVAATLIFCIIGR